MICLGAPGKLDAAQQQAYRTFFMQLPYVIPCATCAQHLQQNLTHLPVDDALSGSSALFEWSVKLHNLVNKQLGKPDMAVEDAKNKWGSPAAMAMVPGLPVKAMALLVGLVSGILLIVMYPRVRKSLKWGA